MFTDDNNTARQARGLAQWIAFAPSIFQAARVLRETGLLAQIEASGATGLSLAELEGATKITKYATRVLADAGLGMQLLTLRDGRYRTTKAAWFLLHDPMTRVNMNFTHEINYRGMYSLDTALAEGRPAGLESFGSWPTVYQALTDLPPNARLSWLAFDHYYSDLAFESGFAAIATRNHQRILDIGGNTGRFARRCVASDNTLRVTIADLPGQLTLAQHEVAHAPGAERITTHGIDLLDESSQLPIGHDAIWMSQFLDCFGEAQIISILRRCRTAIAKNGRVYILEPLWDRQKDVMAAFCLQQTSLYFAAIANGTSRIYTSDVMLELIQRAGLEIESIIEPIGIVHSLLVCKVADAVT